MLILEQFALEAAASTGTILEQEYCFFHILNQEQVEALREKLDGMKFYDIAETNIPTSDTFPAKIRIRKYVTDDKPTYEQTVKSGRKGDAVIETNLEISELMYLGILSGSDNSTVRRRYEIPYHDTSLTYKDGTPLFWELDMYVDSRTLQFSNCIKLELGYDTPPNENVVDHIPYEYETVIVPRRMSDIEKEYIRNQYDSHWNVHGIKLD